MTITKATIKRFRDLSDMEFGHILVTLLAFRDEHYEEFQRRYGTLVNESIDEAMGRHDFEPPTVRNEVI